MSKHFSDLFMLNGYTNQAAMAALGSDGFVMYSVCRNHMRAVLAVKHSVLDAPTPSILDLTETWDITVLEDATGAPGGKVPLLPHRVLQRLHRTKIAKRELDAKLVGVPQTEMVRVFDPFVLKMIGGSGHKSQKAIHLIVKKGEDAQSTAYHVDTSTGNFVYPHFGVKVDLVDPETFYYLHKNDHKFFIYRCRQAEGADGAGLSFDDSKYPDADLNSYYLFPRSKYNAAAKEFAEEIKKSIAEKKAAFSDPNERYAAWLVIENAIKEEENTPARQRLEVLKTLAVKPEAAKALYDSTIGGKAFAKLLGASFRHRENDGLESLRRQGFKLTRKA